MKAFLLAAGGGTRLGSLTEDTPKCLLPVAGRPLIDHWFDAFRVSGIKDVLINVHHLPDRVVEHCVSIAEDLRVTFSYEKELLGSAGTIYNNREFVRREHQFFVVYADVWTTLSLRTMLNFHRRRSGIMTMGLYVPSNPKECGIAKVDRGVVVGFEEKPTHVNENGNNFAFTGIAIVHPQALSCLTSHGDVGRDWIPQLVGKINAFVVKESVIDIGTPEGYDRAQARSKELGLQAL